MSYKSRIFRAFESYQLGTSRFIRGGAGHKHSVKIVRLPLDFLEDLDILLVDWRNREINSTPGNPRYDNLRKLLDDIDALLPQGVYLDDVCDDSEVS